SREGPATHGSGNPNLGGIPYQPRPGPCPTAGREGRPEAREVERPEGARPWQLNRLTSPRGNSGVLYGRAALSRRGTTLTRPRRPDSGSILTRRTRRLSSL